jgi:hypothetical protein
MPSHRSLLTLATALLLTACSAGNPHAGQLAVTPLAGASAGRSVELDINGPGDLARNGHILTDAGAELWSGGHILTDAGAELVSDQGASLGFQVMDAKASFAPVARAGVQLLKLDGTPVGAPVAADDQGVVHLTNVPGGQPLSAVAAFKTGGKVYRLATVLSPDTQMAPVFVDPINTLVEARVRDILGPNPNVSMASMTFQRLKQVWMIANAAGVTVDSKDLEAGQSDEQLLAKLTALWQQAIDSKITSPEDKATIESFVSDLHAARSK